MTFEENNAQYDPSKLSFAAIDSNIISTDSGSDLHDGMRAPFYLNKQLVNAIRMTASDIHFEAYADSVCVRFRVDGVMQEIEVLPKDFGRLVTTRLKVIAGLDISEQNIGQSGRFKMSLGDKGEKGVDFRCSVIPTLYGETLNLRVLHLPESLMDLRALGFEEHQVDPVLYHANRLQGLILITGPTGGGKTVSLYTIIKHINTRARSIYTIEDPVEIELQGINQINVSGDQGFADVTRSLLRQDPDVIMLGEMRDEESCEIAVRAANTGHLVLSTLHANSATKSVSRMTSLGLSRHDIASVLSLVISQRLLRRLDPATRQPVTVDREKLLAIGFAEDELEDLRLYRAVPTERTSGYKGRIGIFQAVPVTKEIAGHIARGSTDAEIDSCLSELGIQDLRRHALNRVKEGITDIGEVERIFGYIDTYCTDSRVHTGQYHFDE